MRFTLPNIRGGTFRGEHLWPYVYCQLEREGESTLRKMKKLRKMPKTREKVDANPGTCSPAKDWKMRHWKKKTEGGTRGVVQGNTNLAGETGEILRKTTQANDSSSLGWEGNGQGTKI